MVIAAGGPGLLVRVAALAGANRSGSRLCHYGRFLAGGALESRPARPDMSTAPARGLTIVVVQKTAAPMDTDAPTLRRWALPPGYPAERS